MVCLQGVAPNLVYTPDTDYEGPDSFSFYGSNPSLVGDVAIVNINVTEFDAFIAVSASAAVTNYHATGDEAKKFRSTGISKNHDADGDDAYGTAGYYFFGNETSTEPNSDGSLPWVMEVKSTGTTLVWSAAYGDFDDPTAGISHDAAEWTGTTIGLVNTAGTTGGLWAELMTFKVDASAPRNFRLGVMAGNESTTDGRWDPAALRLSFEGGDVAVVSELGVSLGMVFFDITLLDGFSGEFSIEGQNRSLGGNTRGPSIAGITFDYASPLNAWLVGNTPSTGNGIFDDPDNDGTSNILEYVLGGDPTKAGDDILPEMNEVGDNFVFSFDRLAASAVDTKQVFQYGSTLAPDAWVDINITDPQAPEVSIGDEVNGLQTVTVTISKGLVVEGKLFRRLQVTLR